MVFNGVDPSNSVYFIRRFVKMQLASTQVFPYFRRSGRKYIIDVKRKFVFAALCQRVKVGGKQFFDLSNAVIYGVSMSIDNPAHVNEIVDELKKYGTVTVDTDMCIICVVGDLDWSNVGFETLATEAMKNIPVRMISYGGSNYNISFLIKGSDKKRALQSLSNTLFNK